MKLEDKRNEDPKLKTKRFLPDKSSIIAVERRFVTAHLF